MKLLNKIPIHPDISHGIFDGLRNTAQAMNDADRHCVLSFDELSILPNLQYNHYNDIVEGFEDFGDRRTTNIANHVQVINLKN